MNQVDSNSDIDLLHKLGLTILEAKTYSTLMMIGESDVKGIAQPLDIAKCEVYRAISSLEKLGLVEKRLSVPSVYKASPIRDASQILLRIKEGEYRDLKKKAKKLVVTSRVSNLKTPYRNQLNNIIISNGKMVEKRLEEQLKLTRKSFEAISTGTICVKMLIDCSDNFERFVKDKIKVRVLTDNFKLKEQVPEFLVTLQKSPYFEIRYYKSPLKIKLAIRDREDVNICCSAAPLDYDPNFWSNNPIFVQLATNCFEYMWNETLFEKEQRQICQTTPAKS